MVGSQAILGSFHEDQLPIEATMSLEIDILPMSDSEDDTARLADLHRRGRGGVLAIRRSARLPHRRRGPGHCCAPEGWRSRLVTVRNANTAAPWGKPQFTGWCLDKEDLCVAKICAFRERDQRFVAALLDARLVDSRVIATRLPTVPERFRSGAERAVKWLASASPGGSARL